LLTIYTDAGKKDYEKVVDLLSEKETND